MKVGIHALADFHKCDTSILDNEEKLLDILTELAIQFNFTIFDSSSHKFAPQGVTCYLLVGESHFSIHTWPEYKHASVDLFSCKKNIDIIDMLDQIGLFLKYESADYLIASRGTRGPIIIRKTCNIQ